MRRRCERSSSRRRLPQLSANCPAQRAIWVESLGSRDSQMEGQSSARVMVDACARSQDGEQPSHIARSTCVCRLEL